ncbi:MAG TPA: hypothetical protein VJ978_08950, partial [Nitriliruptoraceae bacterium]|nr:hypothetical protein [Nitriliruptoraceae bacterium]
RGEVVHELRGPATAAGDVAWSLDSTRVAVAGDPGVVWDLAADDLEPVVLAGVALDQSLLSFGDDPDAIHEGSNAGDGIRTWSLARTVRAEETWLPGSRGQTGIDWSPEGDALAASVDDGDLAIWDRATWEARRVIEAHGEAPPLPGSDFAFARIVNLDWSPDGSRIATAGFDDVAVWDAATGSEVHRVDAVTGWSTVAWTPTGDHLAVAGTAPEILVLDRDGGVVARLEEAERSGIEDLRFSPDGQWLAVARTGTNNAVGPLNATRIWDWEREELVGELESQPASVHWDGTGERLLIGSPDEQLWDVSTLAAQGAAVDRVPADDVLGEFLGHTNWVQEAVFSPDERRVATCSGDGTARLWDAVSGDEVQRLVAEGISGLCRVRFSPDGRLVAISDARNGVRVLTLDMDELVDVAASRVLRDLSDMECREYLGREECAV